MATNLITLHAGSNNPFERARCTLIMALGRMKVPGAFGSYAAEPDDFSAIGDHIREAAAIFDGWLRDIGHQVSDNATAPVDLTQFDDAFTGAVDGNATYVCELAAQAIRTDARELVS